MSTPTHDEQVLEVAREQVAATDRLTHAVLAVAAYLAASDRQVMDRTYSVQNVASTLNELDNVIPAWKLPADSYRALSIADQTLTSAEAEEVILGMAMRRQQVGLSAAQYARIASIGDKLAASWASVYGWDPGNGLNLFRAHLQQPRRVTVR